MPEYLAPGVYVEEIEIGPKPIEGVSTSTAGFLGLTERGPITPRLVTSFGEFERVFGGYIEKSYMAHAVDGFFRNGGKRCFIGRVVKGDPEATDDKAAKAATAKADPMTITAVGEGEWGNRIVARVQKASSNKDEMFRLTLAYWKRQEDVPTGGGGGGGGAGAGPSGGRRPRDRGGQPPASGQPSDAGGPGAQPPPGGPPSTPPPRAPSGGSAAAEDPEKKWKDALAVAALVEVYDNLSSDPTSGDYYLKRLDKEKGVSSLVFLGMDGDPKKRPGDGMYSLSGGSEGNGDLTPKNFVGKEDAPPGSRTGLTAFTEVDEISILYAPDLHHETLEQGERAALLDSLVSHCETLKDRFLITEAPRDTTDISNLRPPTDSKYAAFYYPWIMVHDEVTKTIQPIPPGGHMAGIYARSDIERGVHKAPANEVVRGALDLEFAITKGEQDLLNPRGVNCIRAFPGRGIRIWGARTMSSDSLWKYINVRRLFLYLEESIDEGTQWVVFEPNNEKLWARVRQSVTDFLTRVWKDGALMGTKPEEAFFVKCDRSTMTDDDIDNGRLIVLIGVAPTKPAEFVIFRIAQWRSGSAITE